MLNKAYKVMTTAHHGQYDQAGMPFILHPQRVMMRLPSWATDEEKQAALLHDVLEDTPVTVDDLRQFGFSEQVIEIVQLVTNPKTGTYMDFIYRIAHSDNISALLVKLADNEDNSDPVRYGDFLGTDGGQGLLRRYKKARDILLAALPLRYGAYLDVNVPREAIE